MLKSGRPTVNAKGEDAPQPQCPLSKKILVLRQEYSQLPEGARPVAGGAGESHEPNHRLRTPDHIRLWCVPKGRRKGGGDGTDLLLLILRRTGWKITGFTKTLLRA
jgi:hypothetical protein